MHGTANENIRDNKRSRRKKTSKFDGKVRDLDVYQYKLYEQVPFVIGIAKFEPYTERIHRQVLCTHRNEKTN